MFKSFNINYSGKTNNNVKKNVKKNVKNKPTQLNNPTTNPTINPITNPTINPITNPITNPTTNPTIKYLTNVVNNELLNSDTYLLSSDLIITRNIDGSTHTHLYNIDSLDIFDNFILIVDFPNLGGGTTYFMNTIVSKYKWNSNLLIVRNIDNKLVFNVNDDYLLTPTFNESNGILFLKSIMYKVSKIFVNHTLFHTNAFINSIFEMGKEVTGITHDYSMLFEKYNPYYYEIPKLTRNTIDINKYDQIITQNIINLNIYKKYLHPNKKIVISPIPDFKESKQKITTNNQNIVIGIIGAISEIKGLEIVTKLIEFYKNNDSVKIIVFGTITIPDFKNYYWYNTIFDLNKLFIEHKPNILLETSFWPETWSYTLTIAMMSQLPIISFKKKYPSAIGNRLKNYKKQYIFNTINDIDKMIKSIKQDYFYTIEPKIYYNNFWSEYFNTNNNIITNPTNYINFKNNIKPYCIYFPQFHTFEENNKAYYQGFTDIQSAYLLNVYDKNIKIETPLTSYLNIQCIKEYDLTNVSLVQKQINLLSSYNFAGFAMYYYWFSTNNVSEQNMLMSEVIDIFFTSKITMKSEQKIFFIWANEDWHKNPAFGNGNLYIKNDYNKETFLKNINNMIPYFKHDNYLKINNKPVFFIHHPQHISELNIDLFKELLSVTCIQNGFSGVELVLNSQSNNNDKYLQYNHHPNYKNPSHYKSKQNIDNCIVNTLDYGEYVSNVNLNSNEIQSVFLNFDNRPRLFLPNHLEKATVCVNIEEKYHELFIRKIVNSYNHKKNAFNVTNIMLINSWNEWGENMAIEPSRQLLYYYLNLLKKELSV